MLAATQPQSRMMRMAKKASRKGAGRPPKDPNERLGSPISVGFNQAQRELVDLAAAESGGTLSEFVRDAAVEKARKILGRDE